MNTFFLSNTPLFHGIREDEIREMLSCLNAREKTYKKDETVFRSGSSITEIGLVLSGSVNIVVNFYWGNSHIFGHVGKGQYFAETYALLQNEPLLVDVSANEKCNAYIVKKLDMGRTANRNCNA